MAGPIFPDNFLKGVALSVFQNAGDKKSNWTDFIKRKNYLGQPENADAFAKAADFWEMYEADIKTTKEVLGATSFRFSFEWARIEPDAPGVFDEAAFDRYSKIIDCCHAHGLEPMATLHHFVHPTWFEALKGFEKEENLHHYVAYAEAVFKRFGTRIKLWATFNEPTCYAFVGYIVSLWCPGKLMRLNLAGQVLCNLIKAHCSTYRALKMLPGGREACVGIVHQHIMFTPRHNWPHVRALCKWMTFWFGTHSMLTFFRTGVFEWDSPFSIGGPRGIYKDKGVAAGEVVNDWWGINYYSRPCVNWNFSMGPSKANEPVSDIHFRLYPQGLYDSIKDASVLKLPIYITEMGLADKEDLHRGKYIQDAYAMLLKSIADGYDVRGAYWWTLMDNIEWHDGFKVKFGLYQWDADFATKYKDTNNRPPGGLRLREGAKQLPLVYNSWPDKQSDLRKLGLNQHPSSAALDSLQLEEFDELTKGGPSKAKALGRVKSSDSVPSSSQVSTTQIKIMAGSGSGSIANYPKDTEYAPLVSSQSIPTVPSTPGWSRSL